MNAWPLQGANRIGSQNGLTFWQTPPKEKNFLTWNNCNIVQQSTLEKWLLGTECNVCKGMRILFCFAAGLCSDFPWLQTCCWRPGSTDVAAPSRAGGRRQLGDVSLYWIVIRENDETSSNQGDHGSIRFTSFWFVQSWASCRWQRFGRNTPTAAKVYTSRWIHEFRSEFTAWKRARFKSIMQQFKIRNRWLGTDA